ncbi:hypothetical protein [Microbacterium lacticum]
MPDKIEDSYYFSYPFEYIARNHGDDKYDIGYATMNISVVWNDSEEGYDVSYDVPEIGRIDPAQGNGDAADFFEHDVSQRLMSDLTAAGVGPDLLVDGGY